MWTTLSLTIAFLFLYLLYRWAIDDSTFVHVKTGNKYLFLFYGKMKNPDGNWVYSVTYKSKKDSRIYTRELDSFYDHFVKLSKCKEK